MKLVPSKANTRQLLWGAAAVVVGLALFNTLRTVAGSTLVGRALDGSLVRRA